MSCESGSIGFEQSLTLADFGYSVAASQADRKLALKVGPDEYANKFATRNPRQTHGLRHYAKHSHPDGTGCWQTARHAAAETAESCLLPAYWAVHAAV